MRSKLKAAAVISPVRTFSANADWASKTHVDVLTRKCDVWIDDDQVINQGRYQLDRLGLS